MTNIITKTVLGAALAATALVSATPASAHDYYGERERGSDTAGAAIVGGVIGLALGALVASSSSHHQDRDRYYNRGYNGGGYYNQGQTGYYNGYNNGYYNGSTGYNGYENSYYERRGYYGNQRDYRRGY